MSGSRSEGTDALEAGAGFEIHDPTLDAERLVQRIRERAQRRLREGGERHLVSEWPEPPRPSPDGGGVPWTTVLHHLDRINVFHDPTPHGPEPRPGLGPKGLARAAGRALLHPYHELVLARQAQFNASVANLLNALLPRLQVHEGGEPGRLLELLGPGVRDAVRPLVGAAAARISSEIASSVDDVAAAVDRLERERGAARIQGLEAEMQKLRQAMEGSVAEARALIERVIAETEGRRAEEAAVRGADVDRALDALRQALALHTSRVELLRSEWERAAVRLESSAATAGTLPEAAVAAARSPAPALLDPREYQEFEEQFRGARDDVRRRQEIYLPLLLERLQRVSPVEGAERPLVLDLGCGRGEFLEILRDAGVPARGVDVNEAMVDECRRRGLDVEWADALAHLRGLDDASLGAVVGFQLVEHLALTDLVELLRLCRRKLRDGGVAIWETVNPLNLVVSAATFYLDPTHVRQLHPRLLQFLARTAGFSSAEIRFATPVPEGLQLQEIPADAPTSDLHNANLQRLNDLLFGPQEYAVLAVA